MAKRLDALDIDALLWKSLKKSQIRFLFDLVAANSWWVSPRVFKEVEVVYPKTRRYKRRVEDKRQLVGDIRVWANEPASRGFWLAQGSSHRHYSNFEVCHVYDEGVWDPVHFTNLANLTAVPQSIASFTDKGPVNQLLRYHAFKVFGYKGPKNQNPVAPFYYPKNWPHDGALAEDKLVSTIERVRRQQSERPSYQG